MNVVVKHQFGLKEWADLCEQKDATIAALQARVTELEAIKIPDDAFTYCAYCGEKSPVDEHNEDLSAHIKVCPKHPMRDVESQLTQRTAELEAAKAELEQERVRLASCLIAAEGGTKDIVKQGDYGWSPAYQATLNLQAELERVRGLVKALPKVEGAVVDSNGYVKDSTRCHALFGADEDAALYVALLQHYQGMEG